MRRLLLPAVAALVALTFAPLPAGAIISMGCPAYDTHVDASLGALHVAQNDPRHTGAWRLDTADHYFTHDGASTNDELWTNVWVQMWQETNGVPGLQRGQDVCFDCYVGGIEIECDAWLTGP